MPKELKKAVGYKIAGKGEISAELYPVKPILLEHNKPTYEKIKEAFEYADKVALVQATGTGKSFLAIQWLADNLEEGEKAVYLAPNDNIANQFKKHIKQCGLAGKLKDVKIILYPSLQSETLSLLSSSTNVDYIVADEFHRLGATTWNPAYLEFLENNPEAKVLGLSATPIRHLDNERDMAKELFEETVEGINLVEAIKQGHIPTPDYVRGVISYSEKLEDLYKKLKYVKKEDVKQQIEKEIKRLKRNIEQAGGLEQLFGEYIEKKDGKYILFCSDLTHLHEVKSMIQNGLFGQVNKAVEIYDVSYQKTDKQVEREIDKFETSTSNALKIMLSVELLNEGVHVEGIDGCIMMRRTISPRIYLQQLGRALSAGKEKSPLIIDVVENYESLQSFGSYFEREEDYFGEGGEVETVLPFRVKGEAVENEKFISQIEDLVYQSMGPKGWIMLAEGYFKEHGDLSVPRKLKLAEKTKENPLYAWLKARKKEYKEYLEDKTKYQDKVWIFEELSAMDANWFIDRSPGNTGYQQQMLQECKEFFALNGNLNIPKNTYENGKRLQSVLYSWLNNRKKEYIEYLQDKTRHQEKTWIFEELSAMVPNWSGDRSTRSDAYQQSMLQACKEFFDLNGNFHFKQINEIRPKEQQLYIWFRNRKKEYREYLHDNSKYRDKLYIFEELSSLDKHWHIDREERILEQCRACVQEKGTLVPSKFITKNGKRTHNPVYTWLGHRKRVYKDYLKGKKVPQDQLRLFEILSEIDPAWHQDRSPGNIDFKNEMIQKCKRFYEKTGNLDVPTLIPGEDGEIKSNPLASWLNARKKEYREYLQDETKHQDLSWVFEELSAMDPNWHLDRGTGNETFTKETLKKCNEFFVEHGHLIMSYYIKSEDGKTKLNPLYRWLDSRKKEYKAYLKDNSKFQEKVWIFEELCSIDSDWYLTNKEARDKSKLSSSGQGLAEDSEGEIENE